MSNLTMKDTKQSIYDALQDALKKLENASHAKLDPAKEVAEKKKVETVAKAEVTVTQKIETIVQQLQEQVEDALLGVKETIISKSNSYKDLDEAIKIKEAELQELFGIERNCFTLAALINTQNEMRENFTSEMNARKASLEQELQDITAMIKQAKFDWGVELKEMNSK